MRVLNEPLIEKFVKWHGDAREWLLNWLVVARAATWRSIEDVRLAYPAADGGVRVRSGATVTVFDVGGNKYRMITSIIYQTETVIILELMTHAQYSSDRWKRRY
jgi:mRNA interferase HigB